MIINHNMMAINSHRQLGVNSTQQGKSIEKLSSGMRVNRAGDDAAGLSISEKMRGQIRGLNQASRNAQDGISLIQTAEGALNETHDILQRMRELSVQGANDTNDAKAREAIDAELKQLGEEITRIASQTEFNGAKPLSSGSDYKLQVGANESQSIAISISAKMTADELSVKDLKVTDYETATENTTKIDSAIEAVSKLRSKFGAVQNRLEHTIKNVDTAAENMTAAESRVRDTDMAKEMMNYTKSNILNQAAQSMLAQANQAPQGVLSLLR